VLTREHRRAAASPRPSVSTRTASQERGRERERAENEELIVLGPAHDRERGRRHGEGGETPEVEGPGGWVPAGRLCAQHCDGPRDDGGYADEHVHGHDGQEGRVGRRDLESADAGRVRRHIRA